jgi:hypothetical protein
MRRQPANPLKKSFHAVWEADYVNFAGDFLMASLLAIGSRRKNFTFAMYTALGVALPFSQVLPTS